MEAHKTNRPVFQNISPIDHRYSISEERLFEALVPRISEEASIAACVRAETALVLAHLALRGKLNPRLRAELEKAAASVSPAEVYAEEEKTRRSWSG